MPSHPDALELEERIDRTLGRALARLRRRAGLSVEELATTAGLPAEEIVDHERGLLSLPLARAPILCAALGCPLHTLVRTTATAHRRLTGSRRC